MRAGVYTRISLDRDGTAEGVARQRQDALELTKRRGWNIAREYEDNDTSASGKVRRPGFEALLTDIDSGALDTVVAWSLDRLTRNRRDTVRLIEACQRHGVVIALVRGSDLDMSTPSGRLVADVLASVARSEIEIKGDRQRRANLQRAEAGRPHIGRRSFGYDSKGLQLIDEEAALIRWAYDALLAGASIKSIAREWNERASVTTAGKPWITSSVRGVLLNPRNAALRYYNGERMAEGVWPAIVPEETWGAARAVLTDPSRNTTKDRSIKYLLTNILLCGVCKDGSKLATARTQHGSRTYKCTARGNLSRNADAIDAYIEAIVIARLSKPDAADLVTPKTSVDVKALRSESLALRARIDEAATLFAEGDITGKQLASITRVTNERLEVIAGEQARAADVDVLAHVFGAGDVGHAWRKLDIMRQRAIVKELFESITVYSQGRGARTLDPETVHVEWRIA